MGPLPEVAMTPGRAEGDSAMGPVSLAAMATSHYWTVWTEEGEMTKLHPLLDTVNESAAKYHVESM